jgi:hypothetical protein
MRHYVSEPLEFARLNDPYALLDVSCGAQLSRPRFVVIKTKDNEIVAASNDEEAIKAAARLCRSSVSST